MAEIEAVQRAAFAAARPGAMGEVMGGIYAVLSRQLAQLTQRGGADFLATAWASA